MHHVTTRSIAEEKIFKDSGDYATGIRILAGLVRDGLLVCHQFCFMPTHYHLFGTFFDVPEAIHKLNRRYAVAFNRRYRRRGHVFDSPYRRIPIETLRHFRHLPCYIALNPPNHEWWPYGSYAGMIGNRPPFSFVDPSPILEEFGSVENFRRAVDELREAKDIDPGSAFGGNQVSSRPRSAFGGNQVGSRGA
jgi:REP-associated tyrosine transposase